MSNLHILLLGPPVIEFDNQPVQINRRIQRMLLFYLAAEGGWVGRVELIDLFYPNEGDELARRHLREALSKLRAVLPDSGLLVSAQDQVCLDPQRTYCDLCEFRQLVDQIGRTPWQLPSTAPLPAPVYHSLYRAIRLWRTPHFMAGAILPAKEDIEDWLSRMTREAESARGQVLERLADHATASGDLEAALSWLRSALETDELNEGLHYRVMNLLINLGRRIEAIKYYHSLETLYRRELEIAPPPSIIALYQKIQAEDPLPVPGGRSDWPVSLSMQAPFVGRVAEMGELRKAYHRGGLVSIFGEAGAGKSRIVQELFLSIEPSPRLLLAPSFPLENSLPFQPLIELLRRSIQAEDWKKLSPVWISQLTLLLPDLLIQRPDAPPLRQTAPEQARSLLFEAFRQLFLVLSRRQRLLVFLDDAQWVDESTLATFSYLIERSFFNDHGLLVIAARPEEKNPHLDALFSSTHPLSVFQKISLKELGEGEISDLTRYALGQTPSPEFVHRLAQDTGGNPLFLLETLRAILEISPGPGGPDRLPETLPLAGSIYTLVRSRLRVLSPQARQTLVLAALVGNTFSPLLIEKASSLDTDQVTQALDQLESAHLIQPLRTPQDQVGPTYQFVHDKIREVMELELSPARSRLYHLRIARALVDISATQVVQPASVIARHFELGGDPHAAFPYWIRAGQRARRLSSQLEAYTAFRRAENLLRVLAENLADADLYALYASWGELAAAIGDQETISQVYQTLLHLAQKRHSLPLIGVALSGLSCLSEAQGKVSEGLLYLAQALPYLERPDNNFPLETALAYIRRGNLLVDGRRFEEAVASYLHAIRLCEGGEASTGLLQQTQSTAHYRAATALIHAGWPVKGYQHASQALQVSQWTADPLNELQAYAALAGGAYQMGKYHLARLYAQKGLWIAEQAQMPERTGRLAAVLARIELVMGALDAAWTRLGEAIALGERLADLRILAETQRIRADYYLLCGDYEAAGDLFRQSAANGGAVFDSLDLSLVMAYGWPESPGITLLEERLAAPPEMDSLPAELLTATLSWLHGQDQAALHQAAVVEQRSAGRGYGALPQAAALLRARILAGIGDFPESRGLLGGILTWAEETQDVWLELSALCLLVDLLRRSGQDPAVPFQRLNGWINRQEAQSGQAAVQPFFSGVKHILLDKYSNQ